MVDLQWYRRLILVICSILKIKIIHLVSVWKMSFISCSSLTLHSRHPLIAKRNNFFIFCSFANTMESIIIPPRITECPKPKIIYCHFNVFYCLYFPGAYWAGKMHFERPNLFLNQSRWRLTLKREIRIFSLIRRQTEIRISSLIHYNVFKWISIFQTVKSLTKLLD